MSKISPVALSFRNQLEAAFPALRGDAAMHVARNLDGRLKAIHKATGESAERIYESREFKDIIPNLKRKMIGDVDAEDVEDVVSEVIATDPKFSKMEFGEELLTTKEIRDLENVEDLADFISGMVVKVDDGVLSVKSIQLPEELQKKGVATALYKIALARAKKEGLEFASDINPSPEAQRIYARLEAEGVPFERFADPNTGEAVQFVLSKDELAKLSDDLLDVTKAPKPKDVDQAVNDLADVADFVEDTQKVVRAMEEAPTIEDFMLEINKVARKELNAEQMGTVVSWLATKGIKVGHRGALFIADDAASVAQAEEAFAKAFAEYAKGRPPPTTDTTSAFEKVKERVLSSFASGKNAQADGAKFQPSSEIDRVFSELLMGEAPTRSSTPILMKLINRSLVDDLPKNLTDEYLLRISQESFRLGKPISVKELKSKISKALKEHTANKARGIDKEVRIELPTPVSLGGLMSPRADASYSLLDIGRGQRSYETRVEMLDTPATRKIALDSQVDAVRELTPSQMIDRHLKTSKPLKKIATRLYIGGDALDDMRDLPPKVRKAVLAGTRMTQQSVGDAVGLIQEGSAEKLLRFIIGDASVKFKSGRSLLSAGHDMMGSTMSSLKKYAEKFNDAPGDNDVHLDRLRRYFERGDVGAKASYDKAGSAGDLTQEKVVAAFRAFVFNDGGSQFLEDAFGAARVTRDTTLTPDHMKMLESIFYAMGETQRKGKTIPPNSRDQFLSLYKDIDRLFPVKEWRSEPGPVANRITCLIAGHGQAEKARLDWVDLGIAVDAKTADNFKRWIRGEAIDDVGELAKVQEAFRVHGYNPRFMEAAELDGLNFYVPRAARKKLSMALEQAKDPSLQALSGSMVDAIGRGIREAESTSDLAAAWTMRYLKTRMVRGHFLLKSRYFWMNTMDHFNQMSQIVGFRPAFISTVRLAPQTFATNPLVQTALLGIQKAGVDDAGEIMRQTLTKMGDEGAAWAGKLLRSSKWRGDLNSLLEGRDGFLVVNGIPHSYKDMRRICVEEGIAASFHTAELGTKIRQVGDMFLEKEKKRTGFDRIPGAPTLRELSKIAEDMAEGWGERERFGAVLTLVEMGVEPRKAARLTIDALYDYAGSMSKADRSLLVQVFFPFWAFQKNANRQLIDVVFSPKGAYRLGVLRRGYSEGTEFLSHLLYEDLVDPMGINTNIMTEEEKASYETLKTLLLEEYGVPASQLPAGLRRQIQMAFTGRSAVFEKGQWYKLDEEGRKLREKFPEYKGLFVRSFVERPSRSTMPGYYGTRDAITIPYAMNEANKTFHDLLSAQNPSRTYSSFLIPEQSYKAAANHGILLFSTYLAFARNLGPNQFFEEDAGGDLFTTGFPLRELIQPERALLASDLAAAVSLNKEAPPYRLSGTLAKFFDQRGFEILAVEEKENPLDKKMEYSKAMQDFRDGKIKVLPEDPFLNGEALVPSSAYYISGGMPALILKHSPVDELNKILLKLELSPQEEKAGARGELQKWIRTAGVFDVKDINPMLTAARESWQRADEIGEKDLMGVKRQTSLEFINPDDYSDDAPTKKREKKSSEQKKSDEARLKRLRKRDTGEMNIKLE
jgi:GNAT superfamily N-acetyltransferase